MNKITVTICLTLAVLLGSAGVSEILFAATDYPTSGIVYGELESSRLKFPFPT
jgi:hypothetical protein